MKRDDLSSPSCDGCASRELAFVLFNVRFGGETQRHCANCLLKNHQGLFCPMCFEVYKESPPPHLRLLCLRCPAIAHRSCAISAANSESFSPAFLCPACADPSFAYLRLGNGTNNENDRSDGAVINGCSDGVGGDHGAVQHQNGENTRFIDVGVSKVLLAAAQIAAVKISRAATEAKERAAELSAIAAKARKEARDKLLRVSVLQVKEKESQGVSTGHNSKGIIDGVIGVSEFNNGNKNWNQMETGRSNLIRKDGVLPAMPSRNDISVAGIGSDMQSYHMNGGTGQL